MLVSLLVPARGGRREAVAAAGEGAREPAVAGVAK
jgi:hypothetical protein